MAGQALVFVFGLLLAACAVSAEGKKISFTDCGTERFGSRIESVAISPCISEPCEFIRDVNVETQVTFRTKATTYHPLRTSARIEASVLINGQVVAPLPLEETDLCKLLIPGNSCPLTVPNSYTIAGNATVPGTIPHLDAPITFQIQGFGSDPSDYLFCVQYEVKV